MIALASHAKAAFWVFFCFGVLFSNVAYAECKYTNGKPVNGPIPSKQHCSRGYLVNNDQDFCKRGPLSNHRPKSGNGIGGFVAGVDIDGKPYTVGSAKCIPGGLVVLDGWNWCEFDPVGKVNGEIIKVGQLCRGTIIQPLPPSN